MSATANRTWTEEQNRARSETLKGRRLSLEHRAAQHASTLMEPGTEAWQEAYEARLALLREREELADMIERNPKRARRVLAELGPNLRYYARTRVEYDVDVDKIVDTLRNRNSLDDRLPQLREVLE